ncbi:unnamed protein product [Gordionus sp. m RMFG-2023]
MGLPFLANNWLFFLIIFTIYLTCKFVYKHKSLLGNLKTYFNKSTPLLNSNDGDHSHSFNSQETMPHINYIHHIPFLINISKNHNYSKSLLLETAITRSKDYFNLMNSRRSIRFFSSKPVPPLEVMENIIKTAGTSPSGAHCQPWTFVLISNPRIKKEVRNIVEMEEEINYKKRMGEKWVEDLKFARTNWIKEYLETAPYLIIVFKQVYGYQNNNEGMVEKTPFYYQEMSVCIACGILISAIHNAGMVTLTSTPLNSNNKLKRLLNRPDNEKAILILPVGYPAKDATVPNIKRKKLSDIMVHID